jgi:hypothetical protein
VLGECKPAPERWRVIVDIDVKSRTGCRWSERSPKLIDLIGRQHLP